MCNGLLCGHDGAGCSESGLRGCGGGGRAHNGGSTARGCRLRCTASQLGVAESDPPEKADQSTSCCQRHWSGRIELAKGGFEPPNNAMNSANKKRRSFVALLLVAGYDGRSAAIVVTRGS